MDPPTASNVMVKNEWSNTSPLPLYLNGVDREEVTFY
jgi:hypothetical protein